MAEIRISPDSMKIAVVENEEGSFFKMHQIYKNNMELKNIYTTDEGDLRQHQYCKYSPDSKYLISFGVKVFSSIRSIASNHIRALAQCLCSIIT